MKTLRIIIFAKAPQPGLAKTRLIPALGAQAAADLARKMLFHTLREAIAADVGSVELCVTPSIDDAAWEGIHLPAGLVITDQGGGNLGERMERAAQRSLERGEAVILIGTDCVEMSARLLDDASKALLNYDSIIHCTLDGGYALLGLNRFNPFLFGDISWGTDEVASVTLSRLGRLGWSVRVGPMLHDVDVPQDLKFLSQCWGEHVA
jgi:rSAM/selenodomain-associated transferase 1